MVNITEIRVNVLQLKVSHVQHVHFYALVNFSQQI